MIIEKGIKVHVAYRVLFENSTRPHFPGEVLAADGAVCRLEGYVFVFERKTTMFGKKATSGQRSWTLAKVATSSTWTIQPSIWTRFLMTT